MTPVGSVVILHRGQVSTPLLHWVRTLPQDVALYTPMGTQIARQRNMGVHAGLAGEWVLFIDSDSIPRYDTLPMLLNRGVSLIGAVVCERIPPWRLCAIEMGATLKDLKKVDLATLPSTGIHEVAAVGTGCMLIRRRVFEAVRIPWFQCGQIIPDLLLEDTGFCFSAAKVGIPTYLDCEARVGHDFGGGIVWPGRNRKPWIEWKGAGVTEPADAVATEEPEEVSA